MQSSDSYNNQQSFALLLIGAPKSGKTVLCSKFPRPYYLDLDNNLTSVISYNKRNNITSTFFYDNPSVDKDGKPLDVNFRYQRLSDLLIDAMKSDKIDTIIIDSLTPLVDYMLGHIKRTQGRSTMEIRDWGTFQQLMTKLVYTLRNSGKYIIFTAHEEVIKDELSGIVMYKLAIPGQLQGKLAAYFSDVWHTEIEQKGNETKYVVRTSPSARMALGNSRNLPALFEFNWETFASASV